MSSPLMVIAVPTFGTVSTDWAQSFAYIQKPLGAVVTTLFDARQGVSIADKRNACVAAAIESGARTLLFIGDDVFVPNDIVLKMLDWWRKGYKAVTGVYWTKGAPMQPYIWKGYLDGPYFNWKAGEFFEIDWAGCDCLLLDLDMMREHSGPWFSLDYSMYSYKDAPAPSAGPRIQATTEDLYFYIEKLKRNGVKLWCDSSIQCLHEDRNTRSKWGLVAGMPQAGGEPPEIKGKLIADIGASNIPQPLDQFNTVIRFDSDPQCKPDYLCDVRKIPAEDCSFDVAHASHVLEHLPMADALPTVIEWSRIIKDGGELIIRVPNLKWTAKYILDGTLSEYMYQTLYGRQTNEGEYHRNGFTIETMTSLLKMVPGLVDIKVEEISPDPNGICSEVRGTAKRKIEGVPSVKDSWDELQKKETDETPVIHGTPVCCGTTCECEQTE